MKRVFRIVKRVFIFSLFTFILVSIININRVQNNVVMSIDMLNKLDNVRRISIEDLNKSLTGLLSSDMQMAKRVQDYAEQLKRFKNESNKADIDKMLRGVVLVRAVTGEGSGTVIKKVNDTMYILTCYHVIAEIVNFNEKGFKIAPGIGYSITNLIGRNIGFIMYGAEIIKTDEENDLALLKVFTNDVNLEEITIANESPKKGDTVYSVGNPLGVFRTISKGILSNIRDGFYYSDNTTTFGNSGGALYNVNGELVGVPSQVMGYGGLDATDVLPESGLGMSIDLQRIQDFLYGVFDGRK